MAAISNRPTQTIKVKNYFAPALDLVIVLLIQKIGEDRFRILNEHAIALESPCVGKFYFEILKLDSYENIELQLRGFEENHWEATRKERYTALYLGEEVAEVARDGYLIF